MREENKITTNASKQEKGIQIDLPFNIGDTIFFIKPYYTYAKEPIAREVKKIEINENTIIVKAQDRAFDMRDMGREVFLTKEEAEVKLKEINNNKLYNSHNDY